MGVAETKSAVLSAAGTLLRSPEVTLTLSVRAGEDLDRPAAVG